MALTGNIGEWSEIYTLIKLLSEAKVYAGDENLNKLDVYYPILNIIREEGKKCEYKPDTDQHIIIIDMDGEEYIRISMKEFLQEAKDLLKSLETSKGRAFSIPNTEAFMHKIGCEKLKAGSHDKPDINIKIHDLRTNLQPTLGFSIKSKLGGSATLMNSSQATNLKFWVKNFSLSDNELATLNKEKGPKSLIYEIKNAGGYLEFDSFCNDVFQNNLRFIDGDLPGFMVKCYTTYYNCTKSEIPSIVKIISDENFLNYRGTNTEEFYTHKMKKLLISSALGMVPATEWNGRYDANGGYLIVRKDGEIVCFHFYNINDTEDFLYKNTRFDIPKRDKHDFGRISKDDKGRYYINLNLQIRFK